MGLPRGRWVSQGAGGALRDCGAVPVPSWQGQNEGEVSPGWLTRCCHPPCRRNQNYSDILHSLALGDKRLGGFDLTLRFTHLFWFGDLNYRLDMDVQVGPHRPGREQRGERSPGGHHPFHWHRTSSPT